MRISPKPGSAPASCSITASNEWNETGRVYEHNISEMNRHTPFKDTIYSSNLCAEIALPTAPYNHVTELYAEDDISFVEVQMANGTRRTLPGKTQVQVQRGSQSRLMWPDDLQAGDALDGTPIDFIVRRSSPKWPPATWRASSSPTSNPKSNTPKWPITPC